MKVSVLIEDTCGNPIYRYEHGLSVYVETKEHKVLVDTGATSAFLENAQRMGIDLSLVDTVIISHGHYDHAGGILSFNKINPKAKIYIQKTATGAFYHGDRYIGIDQKIVELPQVCLLEGNYRIDKELYLFTGIVGRRCYPKSNLLLSTKTVDGLKQDTFAHEQCLVIEQGGNNLLLSGCAHNGILNILDRYREFYTKEPAAVFSGFHMMKKEAYTTQEASIIQDTARELTKMDTIFYTGHCTGSAAIDLMKPIMEEKLQKLHCGDLKLPFDKEEN